MDHKIKNRLQQKKDAMGEDSAGTLSSMGKRQRDADGEDEDKSDLSGSDSDHESTQKKSKKQDIVKSFDQQKKQPLKKSKKPSPDDLDDDDENNNRVDPAKEKRKKEFFASDQEIRADLKKQQPSSKEKALEWEDLQLGRALMKAIQRLGYQLPTPIQARAIPIANLGRDICGSAVTGSGASVLNFFTRNCKKQNLDSSSGKTASFVLPILQRLMLRDRRMATIRALILLPTRELAVQCHSVVENLAHFTDVRCCLVVGP